MEGIISSCNLLLTSWYTGRIEDLKDGIFKNLHNLLFRSWYTGRMGDLMACIFRKSSKSSFQELVQLVEWATSWHTSSGNLQNLCGKDSETS